MPVVAVVNRKGGSGKSTLATHIAAYCARSGIAAMLGDIDKQQSTQTWLKLRAAHAKLQALPILGWTVDPRSVLRAPAGVTHVILDTPGGLHGFDLARVAMFADAILMPVCNSVFDRESAAACYAELRTLPRVASGRCKVAAVGMRIDSRTKASETLQAWADERQLPFLGVLRETQAYVRCIEEGLTLFDMPASRVELDRAQWRPIVDWLEPILRPPVVEVVVRPPVLRTPEPSARAVSLKPVQGTMLQGAEVAGQPRNAAVTMRNAAPPPPPSPPRTAVASNVGGRVGLLLGALPRLLQRTF